MPFAPAEARARLLSMITPSNIVPARKTVLIVDDDPAVRSSLQFCLEIEGFLVRTYASGSDLLNDEAVPDSGCLVIDYRLPSMNGLDLLSELRRRKIMLPAIVVTTGPSMSVRAQTAAAGAVLIEKPLLNEALFDGIRAAMSP
jgi:two-component system, LuxR family, response regulator FixJ